MVVTEISKLKLTEVHILIHFSRTVRKSVTYHIEFRKRHGRMRPTGPIRGLASCCRVFVLKICQYLFISSCRELRIDSTRIGYILVRSGYMHLIIRRPLHDHLTDFIIIQSVINNRSIIIPGHLNIAANDHIAVIALLTIIRYTFCFIYTVSIGGYKAIICNRQFFFRRYRIICILQLFLRRDMFIPIRQYIGSFRDNTVLFRDQILLKCINRDGIDWN